MTKTAYLLLFCCLLIFQSCFEIIEQVFLKNDGSGNFELVVNLSKSKTKLNSISKMRTVNGHEVPTQQQIREKVAGIEKAVSKTAGITNVKTTLDFDNYIATIKCDFNKVTQLNAVVKNLTESVANMPKNAAQIYSYDAAANIFSRLNNYSLKKDYQKMSNADKEVFSTANYTFIYKFEPTVTATSNKEAKVSPSKKAVMLKLNALDIITEKKSIENKIQLTKP